MSIFQVFVRAFSSWKRDWLNLTLLNLAWMLCWLTVILGPPATFVAYRVANGVVHGRTFEPRELPGWLLHAFGSSWLWFLLQLGVAAAVLLNLQFYGSIPSPLGPLLQGAILAIAAIWALLQVYALPFLMEQEHSSLRQALRNGILTVLASPLYSLLLALFVAGLLGACVRLPFLLLLGIPMLIALIGSHAVIERIERFGSRSAGMGGGEGG